MCISTKSDAGRVVGRWLPSAWPARRALRHRAAGQSRGLLDGPGFLDHLGTASAINQARNTRGKAPCPWLVDECSVDRIAGASKTFAMGDDGLPEPLRTKGQEPSPTQ